MPDTPALPPTEAETAKRPHGTPPGEGTILPAHGGRIGNPPYVRDEAIATRVRTEAKLFPPAGERLLARRLGITLSILRDHYAPELELGRGELIASLASQEIALAMDSGAGQPGTDGTPPKAKGDPSARRWVLTKMGGWITKHMHEVSGPDGAPIRHEHVDLSKFTTEQLIAYGRLSAIQAGLDPDGIIAVPVDD